MNPNLTAAAHAANRAGMDAKMERTMLGLAVSALSLHPGQSRSQKELARFCGCSHQAIAEIEHRAARKVRLALKRRFGLISTNV